MEKIYLDTCVISGLIKQDMGDENYNNLVEMLSMDLCIVSSQIARDEINAIPPQYRKEHADLFDSLNKIPVIQHYSTCSNLMLMGVGGGRRYDPLFAKLKNLLPDENDALHIFQACKNSVTDFITIDNRTILRFALQLEEYTGMQFVPPRLFKSEFLFS